MTKRFRVLLAATAVSAAGATLMLAAQGAQASTTACTRGAYEGYCGTQANNDIPGLVLDSAGRGTAPNTKVIGWPDSTTDPGTDWFQLPYGGNSANGFMFVFAPRGVISNMCASDPGDGRVVLRGCNGSNWQRWISSADPEVPGFQRWTDAATQRILASGAKGAQMVTVAPPNKTAPNQIWKFSV
jgi:hypothetical protein